MWLNSARYLFTTLSQIKHCNCRSLPVWQTTDKYQICTNPHDFALYAGCGFAIGQSSETDSCDPLKRAIKK